MRGEFCVGFASILSLAAVLLLIFSHVGQINTTKVPRGIYMARVNVSQYGESLQNALSDPVPDLYTTNASAPLMAAAGLRQTYQFGLYTYCAYVDTKNGICSNHTFGHLFQPYEAITNDMASGYRILTDAIITGTTFRDSGYLGQSSKAAFWMLFIGTLGAGLAFLIGLAKHGYTFLFSAILAAISSILILISASIWTVIIKKSESVGDIFIGLPPNSVAIGMQVSVGSALYMIWAAFACLFISVLPYMISCCTFRG